MSKSRKIMTAALGVAAVSYVAGCGRSMPDADGRGRGDRLGATDADADVILSTSSDVVPSATSSVVTTTSVAPIPGATGSAISGNLLPPPSTFPTSLPPDWTSGPTGTGTAPSRTTNYLETVTGTEPPETTSANPADTGAVDAAALLDAGTPVSDSLDAGIVSGNLLPPPLPDSGGQ
jgi:hypothetical protein